MTVVVGCCNQNCMHGCLVCTAKVCTLEHHVIVHVRVATYVLPEVLAPLHFGSLWTMPSFTLSSDAS